jgi:3-dehydroquinate dehydratase/shikimate dehydrogenase
MICAIVTGPTFEEALLQIEITHARADLIELRIDLLSQLEWAAIENLYKYSKLPVLFTVRRKNDGGHFSGSEEQRQGLMMELAALMPAYMDIEHDVPVAFSNSLKARYHSIQLIVSYHGFDGMPDDLDHLLHQMQRPNATYYKIAVTPPTSSDTLRLLHWAKNKNVIAIAMGAKGQPGRVLAPTTGAGITYAQIDESSQVAPGLISIQELHTTYRLSKHTSTTQLYGLIGQPVDKSIGHILHNDYFEQRDRDGVYVKMEVSPEELPQFLQYAKKMPFRGLSVTMPLKERILPYLDHLDSTAQHIGAVNTVVLNDGGFIGFNTDGIGALNAIERQRPVQGKRMIILGAGGAASAIAYEASQRGCEVTILNRDEIRARRLADRLGCVGLSLREMGECCRRGYDFLINTTPVESPIDPVHIYPGSIVMDITNRHINTPLLVEAKRLGCPIVYGKEMFLEQAMHQHRLWFGPKK